MYTPNHDDALLRYSYRNQPSIIWWNLVRLGESLGELMGAGEGVDEEKFVNDGVTEDQASELIARAEKLITQTGEEYKAVFLGEYKKVMTARLGLKNFKESDFDQLFSELLDTMEALELDFNLFFRRLSGVKISELDSEQARQDKASVFFYQDGVTGLGGKEEAASGLGRMGLTVSDEADAKRTEAMKKVNPNFIPRGWILDEIIRRVEKEKERDVLDRVMTMALHPFEDSWAGREFDGQTYVGDKDEETRWIADVPKWLIFMDQRPAKPDPVRSSKISINAANLRPQPNANSKARRLSSICWTRDHYVVEKRPTFGQWVKVTWLDILTLFTIGALAFPVYYFLEPFGIRLFPLDVQMDESNSTSTSPASVILPNFAYPARRQMVSNWLIASVAIAFPAAIILLTQLRIRNFWDLNNSLLGFFYAIVTSSAFQATTKAFVGGFRPNFYDICQPDSNHATGEGNKTGLNGIGFRQDMWSKDACTTSDARKLRDAMQGFPSGHSTTMVAAMLYLCLYLNAKLKVFANYHTPLWKLIALLLPLLGAVLLCGTVIIDNTHSWYDIAGGATIGALISLAAFRMVYASIFDWRINHIPLHRNIPFDGCAKPELVATTRAGWRSPAKESDAMPVPNPGYEGLELENNTESGIISRVTL
ncbi:hypothetical protein NUW58_g5410 [Xylaria curta]|uniref:Uncharacterized protein n=1 Tax=Xylaria curta TaxID=42375 RepID=A0ACC1P1N8_9PEZI|nr:hypothetical protein NUW58_g5410 [Xylaria curta]